VMLIKNHDKSRIVELEVVLCGGFGRAILL